MGGPISWNYYDYGLLFFVTINHKFEYLLLYIRKIHFLYKKSIENLFNFLFFLRLFNFVFQNACMEVRKIKEMEYEILTSAIKGWEGEVIVYTDIVCQICGSIFFFSRP